ncbi:unnamed protein product, partial [Phaeothamnion confervicola]
MKRGHRSGGSGGGGGRGKRPRQREDTCDGGSHRGEDRPAAGPVASLGAIKGRQAVLATCYDGKEGRATKELLNILNAQADLLYPAETTVGNSIGGNSSSDIGGAGGGGSGSSSSDVVGSGTHSEDGGGGCDDDAALSIEEQIRREVLELRAGSGEHARFVPVRTDTRGVVAACVLDAGIDVSRLLSAAFVEIRRTRQRQCRFLVRLSPMTATCYAALEDVVRTAGPLLVAALPPLPLGPAAPGTTPGAAALASAMGTGVKTATNVAPSDAAENSDAMPVRPGRDSVSESAPASPMATAAASGSGAASEAARALHPAAGAATTAAGAAKEPAAAATAPAAPKAAAPTEAPPDGSRRFRIDLHRRSTGPERVAVITALAALVPPCHRVDLGNPEVTVIVEMIRGLCGVSVVTDFVENCRYSVRQLQEDL